MIPDKYAPKQETEPVVGPVMKISNGVSSEELAEAAKQLGLPTVAREDAIALRKLGIEAGPSVVESVTGMNVIGQDALVRMIGKIVAHAEKPDVSKEELIELTTPLCKLVSTATKLGAAQVGIRAKILNASANQINARTEATKVMRPSFPPGAVVIANQPVIAP